MHDLIISGSHFLDKDGRVVMLRGINLGGSSKVPKSIDGKTITRRNFFQHRSVSFVGRPFPLNEADDHFKRLKSWGFNLLRILVTWEAIEHAGPGIYDEQYLEYLTHIVKKAGEYGFTLIIDPHQDVWSRFSGGDGAPGWTLELAGFNLRNLHATGAAFIYCMHEGLYPRMIWPTNNSKLAAGTMFTLFFGGKDFAPGVIIEGVSIQDYLQEHYINAIRQVVDRLKGMAHVIGYGTLNEPSHGWIGCEYLEKEFGPLTLFENPTILQSMAIGEGIPQNVSYWKLGLTGFKRTGTRWLNPSGLSAWKTGKHCLWRREGVWDIDNNGQPVIIRPDYFSHRGGQPVNFACDYLVPFVANFTHAIRDIDPKAIIFMEDEPDRSPRVRNLDHLKPLVNACHWYDALTLLSKRYFDNFSIDMNSHRMIIGKEKIDRAFARQLEEIKNTSNLMGGVPALIGEFGIPFDMHDKQAYKTGRFKHQTRALDRSYRAIEANLLGSALWNYTAENSNQMGDLWNDEDFSIFSPDQQKNPESMHSGGRALDAFLRPYPRYTAGIPQHIQYDFRKGLFQYRYINSEFHGTTEIFIPLRQYPNGINVLLSDGSFRYLPDEQRFLHYPLKSNHEHTITIIRK